MAAENLAKFKRRRRGASCSTRPTWTSGSRQHQDIEATPGVAGSKPRIAGLRITVQDIVIWHERLGLSADEIATEHDLSLSDVYAALAYYYDDREAIDRAIRDDDELVAELHKRIPSKLKAKLGG